MTTMPPWDYNSRQTPDRNMASTALPPWAVVRPERVEHIERVAAVLRVWGRDLPPPQLDRWLRATYLHDALRDAPSATSLTHGPLAADRAAQEGEHDQGVLDAIRYHSVGFATWDDVGRALYCADYLEPGRPFQQSERAALRDVFIDNPDTVLGDVARRRLGHAIESGWTLHPESVAFWNSIHARHD